MSNEATMQTDVPLAVESLTRRFGAKVALDNVSLTLSRGQVFGLVGENGAGKTTLIKHALGLLRAHSGSVRVFGMDPVCEPERALARVGYLSENREMPEWIRVRELLLFTQAFYPDWDERYAEELRAMFGLDPDSKVKSLSRGQRAQAGLILALAHRPDLLLLDEPSSGLDPVVRRDILSAIIRTVADEGRTVLFSSHLLDEVEQVADHVAMIHEGRVVMTGALDDIRAGHCALTLKFPAPVSKPPELAGAIGCDGAGDEWTFLCEGDADTARRAAEQMQARVVEVETPTLEDIFVARVRAKRPQPTIRAQK